MAKAEKERVDAGGEKRFHFDFAGKFFEDSEKEYFESYVKKNKLEDYVTYHGIVGGEKKKNLLKECYIFALPTRYPNEGQPISILEAMVMECLSLPQIMLASGYCGRWCERDCDG